MELDDLARSAASELSTSVAGVGIPPPASPRSRRAFSAVASLALVALVVGAVVAVRHRNDSTPAMATGAERYFVLDGLPEGTKPVGFFPMAGAGDFRVRTAYFGQKGADDPFSRSDAFVLVFTAGGDTSLSDEGTPQQVQGVTGQYREDSAAGFAVKLVQFSLGQRRVVVASRRLDRESLVQFANALVFDDTTIALSRPLAGLDPLESSESSPTLSGFLVPSVRSVMYDGEDRGESITLSVGRGDRNTLRTLRWWDGAPTTFDGHPAMKVAFSTSDESDRATHALSWLLEDGTLLTVSGAKDEAQAQEYARNVREVTADEWAALKASVERETPSFGGSAATDVPSPRRIPDEGPVLATFSGTEAGISWTYEDRGASECLSANVGGNSSGSCSGRSGAIGSPSAANDAASAIVQSMVALPANGRLLFVLANEEDVVALTLTLADGTIIDTRLIGLAADQRPRFVGSAALRAQPSSTSRESITVQVRATRRDGRVTTIDVPMPQLRIQTPAAPASIPPSTTR